MATLTVIGWRDIPSQVVAKRGRETAKRMLPARFQEAIDRAAMRAGKTSSAAYIADWTRLARDCGPDLQAEADAEAARLEARYDDDALLRLIRTHGIAAPPAPAGQADGDGNSHDTPSPPERA